MATANQIAAAVDNVAAGSALLMKGADPLAVNNDGMTRKICWESVL